MNKINYLIISFFLINNCSFDNKTGIWTGSDQIKKKKITQNKIQNLFLKNKILQSRK